MGLDITAYRKLTELDALFNAEGEPVDPETREPFEDYFKVWENPDFPGRAAGLKDGSVYSYEYAESVFSRSYGSYNRWREALAKLAGYPLGERQTFGVKEPSHAASTWNGDRTEGPFYELINFADNEGCIGPVAAAKLARDFAEWDERAKAVDVEFFYQGYTEIRRGIDIAADAGALHFH